MTWIVLFLLVILFQAATILLLEFRRPAHATAWLFILFLFPLVGFILYYFLAHEYRRSRSVKRRGRMDERRRAIRLRKSTLLTRPSQLPDEKLSENGRLFRMLVKGGEFPITGANRTRLFNNGHDTYDAMLEAIRSAKHHIHMSSYIVRDDHMGRLFRDTLADKARQGVEVRFLFDGLGSYKLKAAYFKPLLEAGGRFACFFPIRISFLKKRLNYRNHRKILVVDGLKGFVGGINLGDEYVGKDRRLGYWRDTHLEIEGDAVYGLQEVFLKDWELATKERPSHPDYFPDHACEGREPVQIVSGGPNRRGDAIHDAVYALISSARERIWITTPYFIPSAAISMALHDAAMSGLDVRILIPSIPDTYLVHWATLSYVEELMKSGVRVWQYQKGFVHAKTIVIDKMAATVGTANMDLRSFFSNFELNAHLFDAEAISRVENHFLEDLQDSTEMRLQLFRERSKKQKTREALARLLSPLL
ncbi:cardiolipin synthase [Cohnella faecalis]|uniref:Cardiolipin synthase n=1 Tax=Cohnella faecalis TaxID=2315694 RepID=A0A398CVB2_9BACL|nr:cardiolipin synthase [Cohnella faecalis]RIE03837.1 cardiolipin synthase [Cohnella faecalis]